MLIAPVITILGWSLSLLSAIMLIPSIFAFSDGDVGTASAFFASAIMTLFLGGGLIFASRMETPALGRREAFLVAGLIWTIVPMFAAVPIYLSDAVPHALDAYFEAMSGFTTNGASVIDNLEEQSRAILLWRALIQWIGGFALIVFVSSLASTFGIPGSNSLNRAIAKSTRRRLSRRIRFAVVSILQIYTILTAACIVLLWFSGMQPFEALCYGFSTLSTGGFTVSKAGYELFENRFIEAVLIIFMIIGAINFSLHWAFFNGDRKSYFKNPEYRYLLYTLVFSSLVMFMVMTIETSMMPFQNLRYAIFNSVSAITTTGYTMPPVSETGGYFWPIGVMFLLFLMMTIGGSTGSTAGGLKLMRVILLLKQGAAEIKRLSFPRAIVLMKYAGTIVTREQLLSAWGFFSLYCLSIIVVSLCLSFVGLDLQASISLAIANLANSGASVTSLMTGVGSHGTNFISYGMLPSSSKVILVLAMLVGRLEFFAVLTLFNPALWRR